MLLSELLTARAYKVYSVLTTINVREVKKTSKKYALGAAAGVNVTHL